MENAGRGVAEEIAKRFEDGKIIVFAGLGNNGGDGFVAVRHLKNFDVEVFLLGRKRDIRTEIARRNFDILERSGIKIWEAQIPSKLEADIVIDAMLGTGVRGKLREPYKSAVDLINQSECYVVSVDLPTGLDPDTGKYEDVVKADLTITFHKAKPGILRAKDVVGEIVVKDIGIPSKFEQLCGVGDVIASYTRKPDAHKGMHGRVLVIGGGEYTGAPVLTSLAAYAAGADIVTTLVPEPIKNVVASFSPNLIVRGVKGEMITLKNLEEVLKFVESHDVVVCGMGVGKSNKEFGEFVEELLKSVNKAVLDAEGIIKDLPEDIDCIITPHSGEFKRVFGDLNEDLVKKVAKKIGCTILLKGKVDLITDGDRIKRNLSGNAGMTVGGTGDVLAGICRALLCNDDPFHSACAAAFINGFSGDLCLEKYGYNFTAYDLVKEVPVAFKRCLEWR